jgi:hypothetical protein
MRFDASLADNGVGGLGMALFTVNGDMQWGVGFGIAGVKSINVLEFLACFLGLFLSKGENLLEVIGDS